MIYRGELLMISGQFKLRVIMMEPQAAKLF